MADFMSMSGVFDRAGEAMLPGHGGEARRPGRPRAADGPGHLDELPVRRRHGDGARGHLAPRARARRRASRRRRPLRARRGRPHDRRHDPERPDERDRRPVGPEPAPEHDRADEQRRRRLRPRRPRQPRPTRRSRALPAVRRVQYLRALQAGAAIGDDETLVLRILRASSRRPRDDRRRRRRLGPDVRARLAPAPRACARSFGTQYYGATAANTALRLARRCMDGETAEWEEEMVADIVEARADRVALIREIGRAYPYDERQRRLRARASTSSSGSSTAPTRTAIHAVLAADGAAPSSESGEWW